MKLEKNKANNTTSNIEYVVDNSFEDDDIDWEDVPKYDNDFAKDIYNCIDGFLDREGINESFINKNKVKEHFNKHCLSTSNKKSKKTCVYYDFTSINDYKNYEKQVIEGLNSTNLLVINSLGDCENISKSFRSFFEGNKYLLLTSACGFSNGNKSISILMYAYSSNVTSNYSQNTITIDIFSGNTTYTMYPVDANYLEQKLNNIITKYSKNTSHVKFNNEGLEKIKRNKNKVNETIDLDKEFDKRFDRYIGKPMSFDEFFKLMDEMEKFYE